MTGAELDTALTSIGWTGRALAGRLGCSEMLVRKWRAESIPIPDDIGRWLRATARAIDRLPAPKGWRQK
jgi:hypothetical protein